jgi:Co/Zn/Cd efflux system component
VPTTATVPLAARIRDRIERGFDHTHVVDLHLWEIGPRARACIVSIAAAAPEAACVYRDHLLAHEHLAHLTVEVHALGPKAKMG